MSIGGKLCLPHRLCAKELDRAVVNFLVPAFRAFACSLSGHHPALHLYPASRGAVETSAARTFLVALFHIGRSRSEVVSIRNNGCSKVIPVAECAAKKDFCGSLFVRYNADMSVTRRQKEVLDFISNFVQRNGYSPSFEEIARGLSLKSLATVHKHITNLQKKGLLQRAHNRSRSIDVLPPRSKTRRSDRLPLLGRIAAGLPVEASETNETIALGDILGNREAYALQVRGDSMRDEHIVDGDYVLVEHTSTARQGEIIVALVRGSETTLKRYYIEGTMVRLQPSNAEMEPIYVPLSQIAIQGRVLGVLRRYV
jgi:repressor LexA